jgi:hypothetical protein
VIFVDHAAGSVLFSSAEGVEVENFGWQGLVGRSGQGHVRPVCVVVGLELAQDAAQVKHVPDEGAVEQFAAASADP